MENHDEEFPPLRPPISGEGFTPPPPQHSVGSSSGSTSFGSRDRPPLLMPRPMRLGTPYRPYNLVAAGEAFTPPPAQYYFGSSSGSTSFGSRGRPPLLMSPPPLLMSPPWLLMSPPPLLMSPPLRFGTPPVNVEEQGLVIDDVRVKAVAMSGGKSGKVIKTKICKHWKANGYCRYNSDCWFAHGNEELYRNSPSIKSKSDYARGEEELHQNDASMKNKSKDEAGSSTQGPNNHIVHQNNAVAEYQRGVRFISQPASPGPHPIRGWSPLFDSIELLPTDSDILPSRDQVNAYISKKF